MLEETGSQATQLRDDLYTFDGQRLLPRLLPESVGLHFTTSTMKLVPSKHEH